MTKSLFITRQKNGSGFTYFNKNGPLHDKELVAWIDSLAIPPAWQEVRIAQSPRSKVLALGYDEAGRQQAIYSPSFRARQEKLKFDRTLRFAEALPKLRAQVDKDLARRDLSKEKVLACIVKLIDEAYFRVGNEKYAKENDHYGITTMRSRHLDIKGDTVTFNFVGKSGKKHVKQITDRQLARVLKRLDEQPGYEIFSYKDENGDMHDIDSADVNEYIKTYMDEEFSAKDFRTWGGTLLATAELLVCERFSNKKERKKMVTTVVGNVAKRLGNTPSVARGSYIDPRVINAYINTHQLTRVRESMMRMRPRKYMTRDELCVLRVLSSKR